MSTPKPPQPSWLLTISSILVIAGCVLATAGFLVSVYMTDLFFKTLALFTAIPPATVGILQYYGTFRRHAGAAFAAAMCLCATGGICCFVTIRGSVGVLMELKQAPDFWIIMLIPAFLLIGVTTIYIAWVNQQWSKRLKVYYADAVSPVPSNRFTLRELFGVMTVLAVIAGLSSLWHRLDQPPYAIHASRHEVAFHLPENATDISYCEGSRGIAYEFTTDEKSFTTWVESEIVTSDAKLSGVTIQPITQPTWIFRYHHLSPYLGGPSAEIVNGLAYDWDMHPPVQALYDRDTSRAYYLKGYPDRYR